MQLPLAEFPKRLGFADAPPSVQHNQLPAVRLVLVVQEFQFCLSANEHGFTSSRAKY